MANWASTSYAIEGSKSDLEKVFNAIDGFMKGKMKPVEENASKDWEGNIVKALGATDEQVSNNYLRGFIQYYEMDGDTIRIDAEEAWGASDFRHVLKRLMPGLTIYYIVEEMGCEVYATNDKDGKYFIDHFYVDACVNGNYKSEYFVDKEQAMSYVANLLGKDKATEEDLENWNDEHQEDEDFIYVHEYEYVD